MRRLGKVISWRTVLLGVAALSINLTGCSPTVYRVRMGDVASAIGSLSGMEGDPLETEKVEFKLSGKPAYDEPVRSAAYIRAGLVVSTSVTETLTVNLKKLARSHAANTEASKSQEDIDVEKAIADLKEKKNELSKEELASLASSAANVVLLVAYLDTVNAESQSLAEKLVALTASVSTDFTGTEAIRVPAVTESLNGASENVKEASVKAPELAKRLTRLGEGLKSIL